MTSCTVYQASQFFTISWSLLRLMSIQLVMSYNHISVGLLGLGLAGGRNLGFGFP